MKSEIMAIFTRTPLHVGAGNSVGAIDSPIMRERHTKIPVIPGSSLKGVLRDLFNGNPDQEILFGNGDSAGKLLIGEARVLAFPVRSAKGSFAWITSPIALARYEMDSGVKMDIDKLDGLEDSQCFGAQDVLLGKDVVLEEYKFESRGLSEDIASKLEKIFDDKIWKTVATRLVIVNDEIFSYFCENACEVVTRIKIDDETGVVDKKNGALFNQEQVPSETMFYAVIGEQKDGYIETLKKTLPEVLQIGGDETIGLGYCSVSLMEVAK